ncbi:MAG: DUF1549 and DUF1553 domain-containing protein [Verrucomicrobiales bacterium]|nr:DUF1549 and DUF1553 domain-containing protein [Verrucomicrobiales bacterium]
MWTELAFSMSQPKRLSQKSRTSVSLLWRAGQFAFLLMLVPGFERTFSKDAARKEDLWSLAPVVRPEVPQGVTSSPNPIDAFLAQSCREKGLAPVGPADKLTWLRRASLDLIGLPPSLEEQNAFLTDESAGAVQKVADRLLESEQHGVRYGRHWLDVLRYSDLDENMPAAPGIHLWRDWVISAVNDDLPYDEFARAQILGNRAAKRRIISAAGHLTQVEPRPDDLFALSFLARGATTKANSDQELAFSAVETISSTFLGMTVGCAKCHDHFYDPIKQTEYYSMKALFDPLVLRQIDLATPDQIFAQGRKVRDYEFRLDQLVTAMRKFIEPYHSRLYEERLSMFPKDVQAAIRKPEKDRTAPEQKIYDDYYPILRIDPPKIKEVMKPEEVKQYDEYLKQIDGLKPPEALPVFWTVAEDAKRASETNYVLVTGDPARPKKSQPVPPGFPFAPEKIGFREGRRETFVDWLTAPDNPLFARVAVNRIWQWHFGTGLHASVSDFGALGGLPTHPKLLDWLAAEFVAQKYSMKWLHRLIVTSETYRRASAGPAEREVANRRIDPDNQMLWKFPLRRLEAEPIRDALLFAAGQLDLTLGGKSFDAVKAEGGSNRRTAYMSRGYQAYTEAMPAYLQTFDAEDGRAVCPRRHQTVTAPQALWLMNSEVAENASAQFAERLAKDSTGDLNAVVTLGFRTTLGRPPTPAERAKALDYLQGDPARIKGFAWLLLNLDEFLFVR